MKFMCTLLIKVVGLLVFLVAVAVTWSMEEATPPVL